MYEINFKLYLIDSNILLVFNNKIFQLFFKIVCKKISEGPNTELSTLNFL